MLMIKKACFFALQNFSFEENNRGNIYKNVLKCSFPTERRIWHMWNLSATNVYNYSSSDAATAFSNESKKEEKSSAAQQLHACWLSATIDFVGAPGHESWFLIRPDHMFLPSLCIVLNNSGFFNPLSKTPKSENLILYVFNKLIIKSWSSKEKNRHNIYYFIYIL